MKQIGDFIGGILGLFFFGAIIFGALQSGNTTAIVIILIIVLLIYIAVVREEKEIKSNNTKFKTQSKSSELKKTVTLNSYSDNYGDDYEKIDDNCSQCGGYGWEYRCAICHTLASLEPSSEKYDGDFYCSECSKRGLQSDNIKEDLCDICGGTGKNTN